jgi:enoyl-CoA hydratase/carnithine racemase
VTVTVQERGRILLIRIEREEKRNAIDAATTRGIDAACNRLDDEPGLRAGVLTGTAAVFSAGTDLGAGAGAPTERGGEYGLIRRRRAKPLIAAVEGAALGGGFEIVLACDLVVASTTARFGLPETLRGVVATSGALFRATRSLPLNLARELLITGATIDAERAYQVGLVNRVTPPGEAVEAAVRLAEETCASSPVSVRETLAALQEQLDEADARGWRATEGAIEKIRASEDLREGIDAFLAKRPPRWREG